jgi:hypothetical protein
MRRTAAAVAGLAVVLAGQAGCSGAGKATDPVTVATGTAGGAAWRLVTFHNDAGDLCLEIRDGDGKANDGYGGGCGGWQSSKNDADTHVDGPGPGGSEFAFGPLTAAVSTVEATAPGKQTLVARAQDLPAKAGAAKFFVLTLPDTATAWTYTGKDARGAAEPLGLK